MSDNGLKADSERIDSERKTAPTREVVEKSHFQKTTSNKINFFAKSRVSLKGKMEKGKVDFSTKVEVL